MKFLNILLLAVFSIFLLSNVSAVILETSWQNNLQSTTINYGQTAEFDIYAVTALTENPHLNIKTQLFNSSGNLIYTFQNEVISDYAHVGYVVINPIYQVTPLIYQTAGSFQVKIEYSDAIQVAQTKYLSLIVNPVAPPINATPVITLIPNQTINENNFYTYDVNATDANGDTLTYSLILNPLSFSINPATGLITGTSPLVSANTSYPITVQVSDGIHTATQNYVLTVNDVPVIGNTPVITILGSNPITIQAGFAYTDAGATATDVQDGNLTANITATSNVNTSLLGNYTIIYSVTDSASNTVTATRNVSVVDTTAPVITLNGASSITITKGGTYTEFGATALDNYNGVLPVIFTGNVNTSATGTYTITYTATDSSGNTGTATRTIIVVSSSTPHSSPSKSNGNTVYFPADVPEKKSESIALPPINLGGQQASSSGVWTSLFVMIIILILGTFAAILVLRRR